VQTAGDRRSEDTEELEIDRVRSSPLRGFSEIRVYYLVSEQTVRVVRVLHGKRDIDAMLEVE
jgi:plasmid stabilization system protein ParE